MAKTVVHSNDLAGGGAGGGGGGGGGGRDFKNRTEKEMNCSKLVWGIIKN